MSDPSDIMENPAPLNLPIHTAECGGQVAGSPCICGVGFGPITNPQTGECQTCKATLDPMCPDCGGERTVQTPNPQTGDSR